MPRIFTMFAFPCSFLSRLTRNKVGLNASLKSHIMPNHRLSSSFDEVVNTEQTCHQRGRNFSERVDICKAYKSGDRQVHIRRMQMQRIAQDTPQSRASQVVRDVVLVMTTTRASENAWEKYRFVVPPRSRPRVDNSLNVTHGDEARASA